MIETAGPAASVAMFDGDTLLASRHEDTARSTAERLIGMIDALSPRAVEEILVDVGPGSFTGLRLGLAAAVGLGIGWGVPVRGYGATALVAARAVAEGCAADALLAVNEGGHGQYFVQAFSASPLRAETLPASLLPDGVRGEGRTIVGNAADRFGGMAVDMDARSVMQLPADLRRLPPVPVYGRAPDAKPKA